MKSKENFRKAVFVVVYSKLGNKIKYLLLKRKKHWKGWEFTKGGIESGEKFLNAVKREVFEETGRKAKKIRKFKIHGKYYYKKKIPDRNGIIGQEYSLYSAEIKKEKIKIDKKEHSNYKWLNFSEAEKKLTYRNQKRCLKIVNNWLKNTK
ncbi:MAG: NUDIX domain-containing protein [Nanoarchaeota archaeon]